MFRTQPSTLISKAAFAKMLNLSRGRISQLIAEGRIAGDALVGENRSARIHVANTLEQLLESVAIVLEAEVLLLRLSYTAACLISFYLGGLSAAEEAISAGNLDACSVIVAAGRGDDNASLGLERSSDAAEPLERVRIKAYRTGLKVLTLNRSSNTRRCSWQEYD